MPLRPVTFVNECMGPEVDSVCSTSPPGEKERWLCRWKNKTVGWMREG